MDIKLVIKFLITLLKVIFCALKEGIEAIISKKLDSNLLPQTS